MKSRLLPAFGLLFCASGAYAAESSVALYGLVDMGISTTHASGPNGTHTSETGVTSGGFSDSFFGLRGHEQLYNGWSVNFQLESMLDVATGNLSDEDR